MVSTYQTFIFDLLFNHHYYHNDGYAYSIIIYINDEKINYGTDLHYSAFGLFLCKIKKNDPALPHDHYLALPTSSRSIDFPCKSISFSIMKHELSRDTVSPSMEISMHSPTHFGSMLHKASAMLLPCSCIVFQNFSYWLLLQQDSFQNQVILIFA